MNKYIFTKPAIKPYNNISGVYALLYNDEIIYIGQSNNMGRRLKEHRQENALEKTLEKIKKEQGRINRDKQVAMYKFINENRNNIYFTILAETADLNECEQGYITEYQPRFNYKGVDVPFYPCLLATSL